MNYQEKPNKLSKYQEIYQNFKMKEIITEL